MTQQPTLTPEQWQSHIAAWQSSGSTQVDYCKAHGLIAHSFGYWKRKLSGSSSPSANIASPSFIPVSIVDDKPAPAMRKERALPTSSTDAAISIHAGKGYRIDLLPGFDPATLRQALAVLRD
jgi:hypothetical protein